MGQALLIDSFVCFDYMVSDGRSRILTGYLTESEPKQELLYVSIILIRLMIKRSKDQLIAQILELCLQSGVAKTKIIYQVNMNFNTVSPYLDLLISKGLIEATPTKHPIFKTTPKGKRALVSLRVIHKKILECLP